MHEIKIKLTHPDAAMPTRAKALDAGYDIRARQAATIPPHCIRVVLTGVAMELPPDFECQIRSRSGTAANFGVSVLNAPGTIDAGYRNEIGVILINHSQTPFVVEVGDRIAQLIFQRLPPVTLTLADEELSTSERGQSGFGSSGR